MYANYNIRLLYSESRTFNVQTKQAWRRTGKKKTKKKKTTKKKNNIILVYFINDKEEKKMKEMAWDGAKEQKKKT